MFKCGFCNAPIEFPKTRQLNYCNEECRKARAKAIQKASYRKRKDTRTYEQKRKYHIKYNNSEKGKANQKRFKTRQTLKKLFKDNGLTIHACLNCNKIYQDFANQTLCGIKCGFEYKKKFGWAKNKNT
jgi:hypothetical protein